MNSRLMFFPAPFPGEILFSIASRYHVLSGNCNCKRTLIDLFGAATMIPATGLPSHIGGLNDRIPGPAISELEIIERHTLFPYYRPFLRPGVTDASLREMIGDDARGLKIRIGIVTNSVPDTKRLRYCPECLKDDLEKYGQPFWHSCHQLPAVTVCRNHGCFLKDRCVRCEDLAAGRQELYLPVLKCPRGHCMISEVAYPSGSIARHHQCFAEISNELLVSGLPNLELETLRGVYQRVLIEKEYASDGGRVNQLRLHASVGERYPAEFLAALNSTLSQDAGDWLAAIVRKQRKFIHPVRHLLMIGFLFGSLDAFREQLGSYASASQSAIATVTAKATDNEVDWVRLLVDRGLSLRKVAESLGITVTTLRIRAERVGIDVKRRRKKSWIDEDQILRDLLKEKSLNKIARRHKVSRSYVFRVLRSHPDEQHRREVWIRGVEQKERRLKLLAELKMPGITRKELRSRVPAVFMWLYRHDRSWLDQQLAKCPEIRPASTSFKRIDWRKRDAETSEQVTSIVADLIAHPEKPVRVTLGAIGRRMENPALLDKNLSKLPRTKGVIDRLVESVEAFQARRIRIVAKVLARGGRPVVDWRIRRLAGLKKKVSPKVEKVIAAVIQRYQRLGLKKFSAA